LSKLLPLFGFWLELVSSSFHGLPLAVALLQELKRQDPIIKLPKKSAKSLLFFIFTPFSTSFFFSGVSRFKKERRLNCSSYVLDVT
jgi:hypothetical protein